MPAVRRSRVRSRWAIAISTLPRCTPMRRRSVPSLPPALPARLDALKVEFDDDFRKAIAHLPKDKRFVRPGFGPAWDEPRKEWPLAGPFSRRPHLNNSRAGA